MLNEGWLDEMKGYDVGLTLQFVRRCLRDSEFGNETLRQEIRQRKHDRIPSRTFFDSADDFRAWMRDHGIVREDRKG